MQFPQTFSAFVTEAQASVARTQAGSSVRLSPALSRAGRSFLGLLLRLFPRLLVVLFLVCGFGAQRLGAQGGSTPVSSASIGPGTGSTVLWGSNFEGQLGDNKVPLISTNVPTSIQRYNAVMTGKTVKMMAAGNNHSVAVTLTGSTYELFSWGVNGSGQLGDNTRTTRMTPVAVDMSKPAAAPLSGKIIVEVAAGDGFTVVRTSDNRLYAWGNNGSGQLGDGTNNWSNVPVLVNLTNLGAQTVNKIACGASHVVVSTDQGNVFTWGSSSSGQSSGSTTPTLLGTIGAATAKNVKTVAAGWSHSIALLQDGTVYSWGSNGSGQLGINKVGTLVGSSSVPLLLQSNTGNFNKTVTAIAGGANHSVFLTTDAANPVYACGDNGSWQLGNGTTTQSIYATAATSTAITGAGKTPAYLNVGYDSNYIVATDGTLFGWGSGGNGRLGSNSTSNLTKPTLIPLSGSFVPAAAPAKSRSSDPSSSYAYSIAAGVNHSLGLDSDGQLHAWGSNSSGQLGNASWEQTTIPVLVCDGDPLSGQNVIQAAAGDDFGSILTNKGAVYTWGGNALGQLGNAQGSFNSSNIQMTMAGGSLSSGTVTLSSGSVTAGSNIAILPSTTGLHPGMSLTGTGITGLTVLSVLDSTRIMMSGTSSSSAVPISVSAAGQFPQKGLTQIASGQKHSAGVSSDGGVYTWGLNDSGQLGVGNTTTSSGTPVLVNGGSLAGKTLTAVAAGLSHTLAVDSTNQIYSWGKGASGQLGNGSTTTQSSPVTVSAALGLSGSAILALAAGGDRSYAITASNLIFGWGDNTGGILGDGSATNRSAPVQIGASSFGSKKPVQIAVGLSHAIVITDDGSLYGWGLNDYGQLGDGTYTNRTTPTAIPMTGLLAGKKALKVYCGATSRLTMVLCDDGKLYSWGGRGLGQLGNGTWSKSNLPVAVTATGTVVSAAAGDGFCVLVTAGNTIRTWGSGEVGQLGNANDMLTPRRSPADQLGLNAKSYVSVVSGRGNPSNTVDYSTNLPFQLALTTAGKVWAWGDNSQGQLGSGTLGTGSLTSVVAPALVLSGTVNFTSIAAGGYHALGVGTDNLAYAWGGNSSGQIGNGGTVNATSPVAITGGSLAGKTVIGVAAGYKYSLALASDGQVYAWGDNTYGQLGTNNTTAASSPVLVNSGSMAGKAIVAIAVASNGAASSTSYALSSDGLVYSWGSGTQGQLGTNFSPATKLTPQAVYTAGVLANKRVVALAAGASHVLALTADNQVYAWGNNGTYYYPGSIGNTGQLGNNVTGAVYNNPVLVNLPNIPIVAITAQGDSSYALAADGRVYAWGRGYAGQIGDGYTANRPNPTQIWWNGYDGSVSQIRNIGAFGTGGAMWDTGAFSFVVQPKDASVHFNSGFSLVSGVNTQGVLVNHQWYQEITQQDGNKRWSAVANGNGPVYQVSNADASHAGRYQVVATSHLGTLYSEIVTVTVLEDPPAFTVMTPVTISLTAGSTTTLSILGTPVGTYKWFKNNVAIPGATGSTYTISAADASSQGDYKLEVTNANGSATSAIQTVNIVYSSGPVAWGAKMFGQIGDGSAVSPNAVDTSGLLSGKSIVDFAVGNLHVLSLTSTGSLYAWGSNASGQLGNGSTSDSTMAVAVNLSALGGQSIRQVACGNVNSYALTQNGSLFAWGSNANGQIGDNTNNLGGLITTPKLVSLGGLGTDVAAVTAGASFAVALTNSGSLFAWGVNASNQLGNGLTADSKIPVLVDVGPTSALYNKTVSKICSGFGASHTLALTTDGVLVAWGLNTSGQLGNSSATNASVPVEVDMTGVLYGKTIQKMAVGSAQSAVLTTEGKVYTWGAGSYGRLGTGVASASYVPVAVDMTGALAGKKVVDIAAGASWFIVKADDGKFYGWGYNTDGELANGLFDDAYTPVLMSALPAGVTFKAAGAGGAFSVFLSNAAPNGVVYAVGLNGSGQLGSNPVLGVSTPVSIPPASFGGKSVVSMAGGGKHALALTVDGQVYAWGASNAYGQQGIGTATPSVTPVNISNNGALAGKKVVAIAAGIAHSLALTSDGQLVSWGYGNYGQLGNGGTGNSLVPTSVSVTTETMSKRFCSIAAGNYTSVAIATDGTMFVWGYAGDGTLGNGTTSPDSKVPISVGGALATKKVIAAAVSSGGVGTSGATAIFAITADGLLYSWGQPNLAVLGTGSGNMATTPARVQGVFANKKATGVVAGHGCAVAFCEDGQVYAWGYNVFSSLGLGSGQNTFAYPSLITGLVGKTIQSVAISAMAATAVTTDAQVWSWGYNVFGQVGDGTFVTRGTPVNITASGALNGRRITGVASTNEWAALTNSYAVGAVYAMDTANVVFTVSPQSVAVAAGGTVTLSGGIHAPGTPVTYQWKKKVSGSWVNASGTSYNPQYTISSVDASSAGTYALEATSPSGPVLSQTADVSVLLDPPAFDLSTTPAPITVNEGNPLSFTQNVASGTGPFTYQWKKNGAPVAGASSTTFSLSAASASDSGVYTLSATNALGSATSVSISVTVISSTVVDPTGTVMMWGGNVTGQMGNKLGIGKSSFVKVDNSGVLAGKTVTQVAVGGNHSLAVTNDGKVYAWGYNSYGQLGNGTTVNSTAPVAVSMSGALSGKTVVAVAAGDQFSAALTSDGLVYTWGYNTYGQLGNGNTTSASLPVAVKTTSTALAGKMVSSLAAGLGHVAVVTQDGLVVTWGYNGYGQLGNGNGSSSAVPVAAVTTGALNGKVVSKVACGGLHTLALSSDNQVSSWGYGVYGQLGNSANSNSNVPVPVTASGVLNTKTVTGIAAGYLHSLAFSSDGQAFSWGYGSFGQLGNVPMASSNVPIAVLASGALSGKEVSSVAAGFYHSVVLTKDGSVASFGDNSRGQFATGDYANSTAPALAILPAGKSIVAIASGVASGQSTHTLVLTDTGEVFGAGNNQYGQLGDGSNQYSASVQVFDPAWVDGKTIVSIVGTTTAAAALTSDGVVYTWGGAAYGLYANYGQVGNGSISATNTPVSLAASGALAGKTVVGIAAGSNHFLAVTSDGLVAAWGSGGNGQIGNGFATNVLTPTWVGVSGSISGDKIVSVAAAGDTSYALTADGQVYAWGLGSSGQLGNGGTSSSYYPTMVAGALYGKNVVAIAGETLTCHAVTSDGKLYSWGYNGNGQIGDGTVANALLPAAPSGVLSSKKIIGVKAGAYHVLALGDDGVVYSWGYNNAGQLGNSTTSSSTYPQQVLGLAGKAVVSLAASCNSSMAVTYDGKIYAWGDNTSAQVGDGTFVNRLAPTLVAVPAAQAAIKPNSVALMGYSPTVNSVTAFAWNTGGISILAQPVGQTVSVGSPVSMSVEISNPSSVPVAYQWKLKSGATFQSISGATSAVYTIPSFAALNAGTYAVDVISPIGTVTSDPAQLAVAGGLPVVVNSLNTVNIAEGDTLALSGSVSGVGPFTYQWRKDGIPIAGATSASFSTSGAPATASGVYTLAVANSVGAVVSSASTVTVGTSGTSLAGAGLVWGDNSSGQLGIPYCQPTPAQLASTFLNGKKIVRLAAGYAHVVVLCDDGKLYSWGYNGYGQVGDNTTTDRVTPQPVDMTALGSKTVISVAAGNYHSVALTSDGKVFSWGYNNAGQLGDGSLTTRKIPVAVSTALALNGKSVKEISARGDFTVALDSLGAVYAWGANGSGQLGINSTTNSSVPAANTSPLLSGKVITGIAAGADHVVAVDTLGAVYCWGSGSSGQLGNNAVSQANVAVPVYTLSVMSGKQITKVAAGNAFSLALCGSTGEVFAWGAASRRGDGGTNYSAVPVAVPAIGNGGAKKATSIAAGLNQGYAQSEDGLVYSFGKNDYGQLGDGTTSDNPFATAINGVGSLTGKTFSALPTGTWTTQTFPVVGGSYFGVAVDSNGGVHTWGSNLFGQLGSAPFGAIQTTPVPIVSRALGGKKIVQFAGGSAHSLLLADDGKLYASGANGYGQLGLGYASGPVTEFKQLPMTGLLSGKTVVGIAVGAAHSVALTSDGGVYSWGFNSSGQLGNGTTNNSLTPVAVDRTGVLAGKTITSIAAGNGHSWTLALTSDGQVFGWGYNGYGNLGNGVASTTYFPVAVATNGALSGKFVTAIAAGCYHAVACTSDGGVYAWGSNNYGQLGNGSSTDSYVPVAVTATGVLNGKMIVAVSAGCGASEALSSDGKVFTWGYGGNSELGNGSTTATQNVPVAAAGGVLALKTVAGIATKNLSPSYSNTVYAIGGTSLAGWGYGGAYWIGNGSVSNQSSPVSLSVPPAYTGTAFNGIASQAAWDSVKAFFTAQPPSAPITVKETEPVILAAAVHAPGQRLVYQWKKDGVAVVNSASIKGATSPQLCLLSANVSSIGTYKLEVTTPGGLLTSTETVVNVLLRPTVVLTPSASVVNSGTLFTVSTLIGGTGPFTYQWRKNGGAVAGATTDTFSIPSTSSSDAGTYDLQVTNSFYTTTSSSVALDVFDITTQPTPVELIQGQTATFSVGVTTSSPVSIQWFFNDTAMPGKTSPTLTLTSTVPAQAGLYKARVTLGSVSVFSTEVSLVVNVPPSVVSLTPSTAAVAEEGTAVNITVVAAGTSPFAYQWRKDGVNLTGQTEATLTLPSVSRTDTGAYSVVITNVAGTITSAAVKLVVPGASRTPDQLIFASGQSVSFSAGTILSPVNVQWYQNNVAIAGATSGTYSISSLQPSHEGVYEARASYGGQTAVTSAGSLSVVTITQQPVGLTTYPGLSFTLTAAASCASPLTYQWFKDGSPLTGETSPTYTVANVTPSSAGSYTWEARSGAISVLSSAAVVKVGPGITSALTASGIVAEPFQYQMTASGSPTSWSATGLPAGLGVDVLTGSITGTPTTAGVSSVTLGATNAIGTGTAVLQITVVLMPPILTSSSTASGVINLPFSYVIQASRGPTSFGVSGLPAGLVFNSSTGVISGMPTALGTTTIQITASNGAGSVSKDLTISVIPPPNTLQSDPVGLKLKVGGSGTLSASLTPGPAFTYQWMKDGVAVTPVLTSPGSASLQTIKYDLKNATASMSGLYTLVINTDGISSQSAPALVEVDPLSTGFGKLQVLRSGKVVDLSKTANNATIDLGYNIPNNDVMQVTVSAPSGSAYSWYWSSLKGGVLQKLPVKSLPILDLSNSAVPKAQGYYCLSVSGKAATRGIVFRVMSFANSKSGFLISSPVAVTRDPATIVVTEGNSAYFSVGVSGEAAAYDWYKVDAVGNRSYIACSATPYLTLDAVTAADSGSYMAVVSDGGAYSVDSNTAGLVIVPKGD